jgi:hypothetical protein
MLVYDHPYVHNISKCNKKHEVNEVSDDASFVEGISF